MRLGLDFDNTLIRYDELFHKVAKEQGLISEYIPSQKNKIRDHLREKGIENEWTKLQGEVYGKRILEAIPWEGMFESLLDLQAKGVKLYLVSHKTKVPYKGPTYDLHKAAMSWLEKQGFFSKNGLNWQSDQVYFEFTKEAKINKIIQLGCSYHVDDLPEILAMLPKHINGVLFCPETQKSNNYPNKLAFSDWSKLPNLL